MPAFHRTSWRTSWLARSALTVWALALLALGGRPAWASPDPLHYRLDQVPIPCVDVSDCPSSPGLVSACVSDVCRYECNTTADCPQIPVDGVSGDTVSCILGYCVPKLVVWQDTHQSWVAPANVAPPTVSYVAPSRQQVGGLCYYHAPLQTFQTRYAYEMDQQGWYTWGKDDLDRSLLMTPVPFYECAGQFGDVYEFLDVAGLVDHWLDPYGAVSKLSSWPLPHATFDPQTCGYYGRYMGLGPGSGNPWPGATHPLQ
jgi:hypothetical protein